MKSPRLGRLVAGICAAVLLASSLTLAQLTPEQVTNTNKLLQQVQASINKLPASKQQALDGYANINELATAWSRFGMYLTDPTFVARARAVRQGPMPAPKIPGIVPVSNPSTDIAYSSFAGFTQSETSTARCGNNVVVGFNDTGSIFETPYYHTGSGGESFTGSSYSTNGGASFTDIGPVNPGSSLPFSLLGGDPVVNCADSHTFYITQIFDYLDASSNSWVAVAINTSTDGGKSWGPPTAAIAKSGSTHLLDKPWSTIDPSNHKHIFVSYTDNDFTFSSPFCGANVRSAIEFVESFDGGVTWSATPNIAAQVCGAVAVQGSQMSVSSTGTMYISWVNLGNNFPLSPRQIQIASYSGGVLGTTNTVTSVQPGGDSYYLQGEFRDILDTVMAIDHSGTTTDGTLYVAWADGRDKIVPDPVGTDGAYAYDDILLEVSFDGGNSWLGPFKINSDSQPRLGSGRDHFQVGIAADNRGYVGACWYDRRLDSENFSIRRHCAESQTTGFSWVDSDIGLPGFAPTHGGDLFLNPIYMGDYDQMTSDFTNANSGFIGAFENQTNRGNPDVDAHSFN